MSIVTADKADFTVRTPKAWIPKDVTTLSVTADDIDTTKWIIVNPDLGGKSVHPHAFHCDSVNFMTKLYFATRLLSCALRRSACQTDSGPTGIRSQCYQPRD